MCDVDMSGQTSDVYNSHPHSFTTKPVSMVGLNIRDRNSQPQDKEASETIGHVLYYE